MSAIARSIELRADWCAWCVSGLHRECKGCPCPGYHREVERVERERQERAR